MWDLVGNPENRFSHNEAHLSVSFSGLITSVGEERAYLFLLSITRSYVDFVRRCFLFL